MNIRRIIQRRIRKRSDGVDFVGDVNAVISANVGDRSSSSSATSRQRVVQRSGGTSDVGAESTGKKDDTA